MDYYSQLSFKFFLWHTIWFCDEILKIGKTFYFLYHLNLYSNYRDLR